MEFTDSLAIFPYHLSLLKILLDGIQCLHRADESPCCSANTGVSMYSSPWESITYELVLTSPAVSCMSCSSYLDRLGDRRQVAIQLFCGCCFWGLFKTAYNILVWFPSSFFLCISLASRWCIHTEVLTQPV